MSKTSAIVGVRAKMHLISILMMAAVAVAFIPAAVSGACYDGAPSTTLTTEQKWIDEAIAKHNEYRAKHGVCPLTYNKKLSEIAQAYANKLASKQVSGHSHTPCLGENLAMEGNSRPGFKTESTFAVDGWYGEIKFYDFGTGKSLGVTGHMTQVLWKDSREVGIAYAVHQENGMTVYEVVANYFPQGNFNMDTTILQQVLPKGSPPPADCSDAKLLNPQNIKPVDGGPNVNADTNANAKGETGDSSSSSLLSAANWKSLTVLSISIIALVSRAFIL